MEYGASCNLCRWNEAWTTQDAAQAAAVWHIHDEHPAVWLERMGSDRPPDVVHGPEAFGRRYEQWERQS